MENLIIAALMLIVAGRFAVPTVSAILCYSAFDYSVFETAFIFQGGELTLIQRDLYYSAAALISAIASAVCMCQSIHNSYCKVATLLSVSFAIISLSSISCAIGASVNNPINVLIYSHATTIQLLLVCIKGLNDRLNLRLCDR